MAGEHAAEFKLSITKALSDQLAVALQGLSPAPMTLANVRALSAAAGVYQLYLSGALVYIGKADKSLPQRIEVHHRKIAGRTGISIADMSFTCLYVEEDFSAVAPERLLISRHRSLGEIPWNGNGFGNNDPGRNRDKTQLDADHFDRLYPIDLDWVLDLPGGPMALDDLLSRMAGEFPYRFRYQGSAAFAPITVHLPARPRVDDVPALVSRSLPLEWQITALPGRLIMYPITTSTPTASATTEVARSSCRLSRSWER